jgi:hypothetical protein
MQIKMWVASPCKGLFRLTYAGFICLLCLFGRLLGQARTPQVPERVNARIVSVVPSNETRLGSIVTLGIEVHAANNSFVVPYCPDEESHKELLCGARLQRVVGEKWVDARVKISGLQLGTEVEQHNEQEKSAIIVPREDAAFSFRFSTGLFGVRKGQCLRVAFEVWKVPEAMRSDDPGETIFSTPFLLPSSTK